MKRLTTLNIELKTYKSNELVGVCVSRNLYAINGINNAELSNNKSGNCKSCEKFENGIKTAT